MTSDLETDSTKGGMVLAILSAAMFIYVVDTTVMNVSVSALVEDLNTTVGGVQTAITLYTLTMAAFMLTGGKLGDIWGSKPAFRIGLIVYGIGTTMTALAPNLIVLIVGWSFLEGLGSALIVPAINTLVRANYGGSKRASAYGVLFGVAAAGAAFGPLIGGWLTSNATWRYAFAGEAVIVVIVLATSGMLKDAPNVIPVPKLDLVGAGLSIVGLGLLVFGVLQTTTYGWSNPLVLSLVVAGLAVLGLFVWWVRYREAERRPTLVRLSLFRHRTISAGLPTLATQLFAQAGLLFLIPVFTQTVLGFDAFETGLTLLPLSIGVLVTSVTTPRLGRVIYPKYIIQAGLVVMFIGGFVLARSLNGAESGGDLALGLLLGGTGIGLTVGQLPNLILSGVEQDEASEASGLQGAFQNLGMAMGTAVVGSVILSVAIATFGTQVERSSVFPEDFKTEVVELMRQPIEQADGTRLTGLIADLPPDQQDEAIRIVDEGTLRGFQAAIVAGGIVALIGALIAIRLPKSKLESDHSADSIVAEIVRNPAIPKLQFEMEDLE